MSSFVCFRSCAGEALLRDATEVAPVPFPDQQATRPVPVPPFPFHVPGDYQSTSVTGIYLYAVSQSSLILD